MVNEVLWSYLALNEKEKQKFNNKYWLINPNNSDFSAPQTNQLIQTASGDILYGNNVFYLRDKHGVRSTRRYDQIWHVEGVSEQDAYYERKNKAVLFKLERIP